MIFLEAKRSNEFHHSKQRYILGASSTINAKSDPALTEKGILAVPEILANAGGAYVSYFECDMTWWLFPES